MSESVEYHVSEAAGNVEESGFQLAEETKILRDTLDLLLNKSIEQRRICEELKQENKYLQDYIDNMMEMGDVLNK
ncbi:Slo1 [Kluyveromyces lactis]|nr:Slo1 [Kluyveromyces lactis]